MRTPDGEPEDWLTELLTGALKGAALTGAAAGVLTTAGTAATTGLGAAPAGAGAAPAGFNTGTGVAETLELLVLDELGASDDASCSPTSWPMTFLNTPKVRTLE